MHHERPKGGVRAHPADLLQLRNHSFPAQRGVRQSNDGRQYQTRRDQEGVREAVGAVQKDHLARDAAIQRRQVRVHREGEEGNERRLSHDAHDCVLLG